MGGVTTKFSTPVTVGMLKEWLEDVEDHYKVCYSVYAIDDNEITEMSYNPYTKKVVLK